MESNAKIEESKILEKKQVKFLNVPNFTMEYKKLNLKKLHEDFEIPDDGDWEREETVIGQGVYGKVMPCMHIPTKMTFAVKRFEDIFRDEQRSIRLLRELTILKKV